MKQITVNAEYDNEAEVWITLNSSLDGLIIEAKTFEQFVQEVKWGIELLSETEEEFKLIVNATTNQHISLRQAA